MTAKILNSGPVPLSLQDTKSQCNRSFSNQTQGGPLALALGSFLRPLSCSHLPIHVSLPPPTLPPTHHPHSSPFIHLSICPFTIVHPCIHPSLSIRLSIYLSLSICLSLFPSTCASFTIPSLHLSIHPPTCPSFCLSISLSLHPSIPPSSRHIMSPVTLLAPCKTLGY